MRETGSGGAGDEEPEELPEFQDLRLRGRSVKTWSISGGAVLLVIAAAFGGLNKAADETPQVAAGTAVDAGQFEVTIQRVVAVKDLKPLFTPDEGGALIAVVTKLKVTDVNGTTPPADLIRLIGVPGVKDTDPPLGTTNIRDETMNPVLTPDAGENVAYVWKLPKATQLPTEVKLTVQGYQHIDDSILDHHEKWMTDKLVADTTVKVKDNLK
ncbi:hypothetical protein JOF29_005880 [Kribbella aluminosa]|uniref:Ribosomally synthesized peptide with SipW-like signal peptide n=1 Tax=Kribbella aluminosa TaxID=416017 RepID=A0ABS4USZ3_9ACTN|nr:hypothetical protein [Kribbella aluminosa]MBP2354770.1 hypothetical protein [Kribbella aluminosa]